MQVIILNPAKKGGHYPTLDFSNLLTVNVFIDSYVAKLKKFKIKPVSTELVEWFDACEKVLKAVFDPLLKQVRKAQNQLITEQKRVVQTLKTDLWKLVFSFKQFRAHMLRELKKA